MKLMTEKSWKEQQEEAMETLGRAKGTSRGGADILSAEEILDATIVRLLDDIDDAQRDYLVIMRKIADKVTGTNKQTMAEYLETTLRTELKRNDTMRGAAYL